MHLLEGTYGPTRCNMGAMLSTKFSSRSILMYVRKIWNKYDILRSNFNTPLVKTIFIDLLLVCLLMLLLFTDSNCVHSSCYCSVRLYIPEKLAERPLIRRAITTTTDIVRMWKRQQQEYYRLRKPTITNNIRDNYKIIIIYEINIKLYEIIINYCNRSRT